MPTPIDRKLGPLESFGSDTPYPPLSVTCSASVDPNTVDVWWSNPADLSVNSGFQIVGVNIYRSFDSPLSRFEKLNSVPVSANFFRDRTTTRVVINEDVSSAWVVNGLYNPVKRWVFKVSNKPIVLIQADEEQSTSVYVTVDGLPSAVKSINTALGEVELETDEYFDVATDRNVKPNLPKEGSVVYASYRCKDGVSKTVLNRRTYYRIATVAVVNGEYIETPIDKSSVSNNQEVESMDWIWREAVRRNKFILTQGGERVRLFLRKYVGQVCGCSKVSHKQAASDCLVCFGTGIKGGYEGPYDILVAPDDAEKKIEQSNRGRSLIHSYETWTGPYPLISQRDFIVKMNGDRYGIGPVRMPSNRGNQLQQHFMISHLDESDIRYKVKIPDTAYWMKPRTQYVNLESGNSIDIVTSRENISDSVEEHGKTVVWENTYRR